LIKLLPYILFEKYNYILALEMANPGTSTVPVVSAHCRSLVEVVVQNVTPFAVFISGCERHIVCCGQGLQLVLVVGLPYYSVSLCFDKIVCRPILFVSFNTLLVSILISLTAYACIFYCISCCFRIVFVYCSVTNLAAWLQKTNKVYLLYLRTG